MATTTHLGISLVEQSQAQKEITVNHALNRIDALLNTGAISRAVATPPGSPAAGEVYIVGASATGAWSGHEGKITYYDQLWRFISPNEGMTLWVNDEDILCSYDGAAWGQSVQRLSLLGVNATADATNRLAVASDTVLLNHNGTSIQTKLNKNGAGNVASFLFQTNYSGRAEFGTLGDDNFTLKVSNDGSSWHDVLKMMAATGRLAIKSIASAVSAAGTNQATATALTATFNEVSTVGSGQGVKLPSAEPGELMLVANQGANALSIYPVSGHSINALASNAALTLATDTRRLFFAVTATKWVSL